MTETLRRRKLRGAGLAAALAAPASGQAAEFSLRDWYAACDNVRTCTAIGFSPEAEETRAMLILTRSGEAAARPRVVVVVEGDAPGPLEVALDGRPIGRVQARAEGDSGIVEGVMAEAEATVMLGRLVNGSIVRITGQGDLKAQVSLSGSAAALRWVDEQQRRSGNLSALVASGPAPATSIPSPPALPVARARPPQPQGGLPARPPAALAALSQTAASKAASGATSPFTGWSPTFCFGPSRAATGPTTTSTASC